MMQRIALAWLTALCLSGTVAMGQTPAAQPAAGQPTPSVAAEEPGATGSAGRSAAAPAGQRGSGSLATRAEARTEARARRAQSYARCNASARQRSLRGAERRRYVARCELGYERPVTKP